SIKPAGYPIPVDGPVGDLLRAQGRANMRPAHLHFLIYKPGFKTHISQVYTDDDPHLETDCQFGVTRTLIGHYVRHPDEPAPAGDVTGPWYSLDYTFGIEPGVAERPRAPISGKARGERPAIERLKRAGRRWGGRRRGAPWPPSTRSDAESGRVSGLRFAHPTNNGEETHVTGDSRHNSFRFLDGRRRRPGAAQDRAHPVDDGRVQHRRQGGGERRAPLHPA